MIKIEVNVTEEVNNTLEEIAKIRGCSIEHAATYVLDTYTKHAKKNIGKNHK